jgi:hypothetical protein
MTHPHRITPTEDERRAEQDQKNKQDRWRRLAKLLSTAGGHSIRPTIGNMLVILNEFEEWKGVIGLSFVEPEVATSVPIAEQLGPVIVKPTLSLMKPPPFTADYDIEGKRVYPTAFTDFDVDRTMIWFEREAKVLIETDQGRVLLKRALMLAARPR